LQDKGFDRAVVKVSPATAGSWSDSRVSPLSAGSLEYKPVAVRCRAQWLRLSAANFGRSPQPLTSLTMLPAHHGHHALQGPRVPQYTMCKRRLYFPRKIRHGQNLSTTQYQACASIDRRRPYHQAVHCSSHSFACRARQTRCHGSGIVPIFDPSEMPARRDHSLFADAHITNSIVYEPLRLSKPDCPDRTRARPILELVRDLHLHANGLRIASG
jgi:hypothetical protein